MTRPIDFVESVGEEHHKIARRHRALRGCVARIFRQSKRRALRPGQRRDRSVDRTGDERRRMAGTGVAHLARGCVHHHIERGRENRAVRFAHRRVQSAI